jgi:hypothetical protein
MNATGTNTDDRERRRGDGEPDLVGARVRGDDVVLAHLDVAYDVLSHDDRVVDQNADREREAEQRHRVEGESEGPHRHERREHGHRKRQTGDHRGAPRVQKQEHHEHGEQRALDERLLDVAHRMAHPLARILHLGELHIGGQRFLQLFHLRLNRGGHLRRAVALRLEDLDPNRLLAVEERHRARLFGSIVDVRDLIQADQLSAAFGDDEIAEVRGVLEAAAQPDQLLLQVAVQPSNGRREILLSERGDHLGDAHPRRLEIRGTQLDDHVALHFTHDVHLRDPGDRAQLARESGIGDAREHRSGSGRRREHEREHRRFRWIEASEDRLLHLRRQILALRRDRIAHILRRLLDRLLEVEEERALREPVDGEARGLVAIESADAPHRILDRLHDLALDLRRRCTGIRDRQSDDRRLNVRELIGVEIEQSRASERDERHHCGDGDDRPLDREVGDEHVVLLPACSALSECPPADRRQR